MNTQLEEEDDFNLDDIFGRNTPSVIDEEVFENPNVQPVAPEPKKKRNIESFNAPIVAEETITVPKTKQRAFVRKEIIIDKFCTKRMRVELTPSVCDICAFDVAEKAGGWKNLPQSEREIVVKALAKHKEIAHTKASQHIVYEDEMPTKWLGGGKL